MTVSFFFSICFAFYSQILLAVLREGQKPRGKSNCRHRHTSRPRWPQRLKVLLSFIFCFRWILSTQLTNHPINNNSGDVCSSFILFGLVAGSVMRLRPLIPLTFRKTEHWARFQLNTMLQKKSTALHVNLWPPTSWCGSKWNIPRQIKWAVTFRKLEQQNVSSFGVLALHICWNKEPVKGSWVLCYCKTKSQWIKIPHTMMINSHINK